MIILVLQCLFWTLLWWLYWMNFFWLYLISILHMISNTLSFWEVLMVRLLVQPPHPLLLHLFQALDLNLPNIPPLRLINLPSLAIWTNKHKLLKLLISKTIFSINPCPLSMHVLVALKVATPHHPPPTIPYGTDSSLHFYQQKRSFPHWQHHILLLSKC